MVVTIKCVKLGFFYRLIPALFAGVFFLIGLKDGFTAMPLILFSGFSLLSLILIIAPLSYFSSDDTGCTFSPIGGGGIRIESQEIEKLSHYKETNVKNGLSYDSVLKVVLKEGSEIRSEQLRSDWFRNIESDTQSSYIKSFEYVCNFGTCCFRKS